MADRRTYTEAEKTEALALYETHGPTAVQKAMGINKGTVSRWAKQRGIATVASEKTDAATKASAVDAAAIRQDIATGTAETARAARTELARRLADDPGGIPTRDLTTMFGVLVDKHIALVRLDAVENDHSAVDAWIEHMIEG